MCVFFFELNFRIVFQPRVDNRNLFYALKLFTQVTMMLFIPVPTMYKTSRSTGKHLLHSILKKKLFFTLLLLQLKRKSSEINQQSSY